MAEKVRRDANKRLREPGLFARLDDAFAHQAALPSEVSNAIRAWQQTSRAYELVQRLVRHPDEADLTSAETQAVLNMQEKLNLAIASGRLPFAMRAFRGVRDLQRTLGIRDASHALHRTFRLRGYSSISVCRDVAVSEFTSRSGALFELELPSGLAALWIAGIGDPRLRRQGELLLEVGLRIHVYSHRTEGSLSVLAAEVMTP